MAGQNAYILGRGHLSSLKLNFQHYLWKEQTGYLLHPSIVLPKDLTSYVKIADVGTGTGIFLLDLSRILPPSTTQLDGFDIDICQAPPKAWLPVNITMNTLDAFSEKIPEELVGKYDVVHIAIFALVVKDNDPGPLLRNLVRMLSECI